MQSAEKLLSQLLVDLVLPFEHTLQRCHAFHDLQKTLFQPIDELGLVFLELLNQGKDCLVWDVIVLLDVVKNVTDDLHFFEFLNE